MRKYKPHNTYSSISKHLAYIRFCAMRSRSLSVCCVLSIAPPLVPQPLSLFLIHSTDGVPSKRTNTPTRTSVVVPSSSSISRRACCSCVCAYAIEHIHMAYIILCCVGAVASAPERRLPSQSSSQARIYTCSSPDAIMAGTLRCCVLLKLMYSSTFPCCWRVALPGCAFDFQSSQNAIHSSSPIVVVVLVSVVFCTFRRRTSSNSPSSIARLLRRPSLTTHSSLEPAADRE